MENSIPLLYSKYFINRQFERFDLFQTIAEIYPIKRVLYAGSFIHITSSFVFPDVVYVDNDKQAKKFFGEAETLNFINQMKVYPQDAQVQFIFQDYRESLNEKQGSFDLLISQYAGFVGQFCKMYLKKGGWLLANNSHGDAGMAAIDEDYQLTGVFSLRNGKHRLSEDNLEDYFVPKKPQQLTRQYLESRQKGIGYKKTGSSYLFRKTH